MCPEEHVGVWLCSLGQYREDFGRGFLQGLFRYPVRKRVTRIDYPIQRQLAGSKQVNANICIVAVLSLPTLFIVHSLLDSRYL